jgi:hypothetical protein
MDFMVNNNEIIIDGMWLIWDIAGTEKESMKIRREDKKSVDSGYSIDRGGPAQADTDTDTHRSCIQCRDRDKIENIPGSGKSPRCSERASGWCGHPMLKLVSMSSPYPW